MEKNKYSIRPEKLDEILSIVDEFKVKKVLEEYETSSPHFIRVKGLKVELANGKILNREIILKNKQTGSAAVMLPITKDNDVILTIEPRVATARTVGISFPAGYIEEGEQPQVAAVRELFEETGYAAGKIIPLASYYQDAGCSKAYNHAFLMKDCEKIGDQHLDEYEYIKYVKCKYEEALYLMDSGYIEDCNAIIALEKSKVYMKEF